MFNYDLISVLHSGVILFWALWWTIVFFTDSVDLLQKRSLLSAKWRGSNNYDLLETAFFRYKFLSKRALVDIAYVIIILVVLLIAILFWIAFFISNKSSQPDFGTLAFTASFILDATFILFDEAVIDFERGHRHMIKATFRVATFVLYKI